MAIVYLLLCHSPLSSSPERSSCRIWTAVDPVRKMGRRKWDSHLVSLQSLPYNRVLEIHKQHLSPVGTAYFQKPLLLHQGHMEWLFDVEGNRYLDFFSGIVTVSVGHCHPWVSLKSKDLHPAHMGIHHVSELQPFLCLLSLKISNKESFGPST